MGLRLTCAWVWVCFQFAFLLQFSTQLHNSILGVAAGGLEVAGGGHSCRPRPPHLPQGPSLTQAPGVCERVCVCACRVRVQGAGKGREACVCALCVPARAAASQGCCQRVRGDGPHVQGACLCVSAAAPVDWALAEPTQGLPEDRGPPRCRLRI